MTRVLLVRPDRNEDDSHALRSVGLDPQVDPYLRVTPLQDPSGGVELLEAVRTAGGGDWLFATSPRAREAWASLVGSAVLAAAVREAAGRGMRAAAVGPASARTLVEVPDVVLPGRATARDLVARMSEYPPGRALIPVSAIARPDLADGLRAAGWQVVVREVYQTLPAEQPPSAEALVRGEIDAVVLRSPSAVEAVLSHPVPEGVLLVAVGPVTAAAVENRGRVCVRVEGDAAEVAAAVRDAVGT